MEGAADWDPVMLTEYLKGAQVEIDMDAVLEARRRILNAQRVTLDLRRQGVTVDLAVTTLR